MHEKVNEHAAGNHEEESEFRYGDDYLDTFDCEDNWDIPAPIGGNDHTQCAMSYRCITSPSIFAMLP